MSNFNEKANQIMSSFIIEGVEEEKKVVKVNTPTGLCDVSVRCINTASGCSYIADESVDCVNKGDDVTEMIASEDEEFNTTKADLNKDGEVSEYEMKRGKAVASAREENNEDSVTGKHDYIKQNKEKVDQFVNDYISNAIDSGRASGDDVDEDWLEQNALDYLLSLPLEKMKSEIESCCTEENEEDPELAKVLGGKDPSKQLAAVSVAGKLATKAQGGLFSANPQKKMNKAYGDLMNKIATKISGIAAKI